MTVPGPMTLQRREAVFVAIYFVALFVYLFFNPESELEHWVSLVTLPLIGVWILRGTVREDPAAGGVGSRSGPLRGVVRSLGLERGRIFTGLKWPLLLGLAIQPVQFLNPSNRAELAEIFASSLGWVYAVVAIPLLIVTVGTTEEVFFRGLLQRRFTDAIADPSSEPGEEASGHAPDRRIRRADVIGIGLATLAFILYHVPYAYLNPNWPSAGDLPQAFWLATVNGSMGGVLLGLVYVKSGRNLMATILLHAMVNWVPGIIMVSRVKFGGG